MGAPEKELLPAPIKIDPLDLVFQSLFSGFLGQAIAAARGRLSL
jgi:hypothetical protein